MYNTDMDYHIRKATYREWDTVIGWAKKEGWNPGLYDMDAFYATDSDGFFLGFLGDKPIASISAVAYNDAFGFLGSYIVKPQYRGKGYGKKIWDTALKHLPTQNIGLDGVVAQQENYKKSGFRVAYRNMRCKGVGINDFAGNKDIINLSEIPFQQLLFYDNQIFPTPRQAFLSKWMNLPESLSVAYVKKGNLYGYGTVRKCHVGFRIGPLFANSQYVASQLFQKMSAYAGRGVKIFMDIPKINTQAIALTGSFGMKPVFESARMYSKTAPKVLLQKIFAVTTLELG